MDGTRALRDLPSVDELLRDERVAAEPRAVAVAAARSALEHARAEIKAGRPVESIVDVPRAFKSYTLAGVADRITAPALVLDPDNDQFLNGQPQRAAEAMLNSDTTLVTLKESEGAGEHCHVSALFPMPPTATTFRMRAL